jgi:hypothetical protein
MDAELLASSRVTIDESRRLLASLERDRTILSNIDARLSASSRAMIDESRRLLATVASSAELQPSPARNLSVRIFQEGARFGWSISASKEMLGWGTAETEQRARIDAFRAGMTYIDRLHGRSTKTATSIH